MAAAAAAQQQLAVLIGRAKTLAATVGAIGVLVGPPTVYVMDRADTRARLAEAEREVADTRHELRTVRTEDKEERLKVDAASLTRHQQQQGDINEVRALASNALSLSGAVDAKVGLVLDMLREMRVGQMKLESRLQPPIVEVQPAPVVALPAQPAAPPRRGIDRIAPAPFGAPLR